MFTDVIGSTSLGDGRDPEAIRRILSRYFDEMRGVVERHGGTVEKYIGDAVVAVFGIPELHEDDALRAVRAAVEMRESLSSLNEELARERGVTIRTRTGLNTGEVVAGDPTEGQRLVTGDAVNVAARLEQAAQSGEVLMGTSTYRLVRDAVDVEPIEALDLRGKAEPVPAFRLRGVKSRAPGFARGLDSPLVGRRRERVLLMQAFERSAVERTCHLFTILGAAGVGKSRLAQEFVSGVADSAMVVRGRCLPYGDGITFWPIVEIVRSCVGASEADSALELRAKIALALEGSDAAASVTDRLADLVGHGVATVSAEETFWAVRRLLEARARRRPLIAVVDDIHWAEPTLFELLEHVADWTRDAPLLLLCLARPELLDVRPSWGGGKVNATSILLEPLSDGECAQLVENFVGPGLVDEVRSRIFDAAEGNPLFVEETIGMLIDDGRLRRGDQGWVPMGDLTEITVPPTIQALVATRVDRLSGDERSVLERASIEGKQFHLGAVIALSPQGARVSEPLMALVRRDLIRPHPSLFSGDEAFRFRHLLIRDAAYARMPKETRAEFHERFVAWLERAASSHPGEYDEILGYHLELAQRLRLDLGPLDDRGRDLATRGARYLASSGRRALARGDPRAGARLLTRAAALLPREDPERIEILPRLGSCLSHAGLLDKAATVLDEAVELAGNSGDRRTYAFALLERASLRIDVYPEGAAQEAREHAEVAIRLFEEFGDERGLASAWRIWSEVDHMLCRWGPRREAMERALIHARRAGDGYEEERAMATIAYALLHDPTPVPEAIIRCDEMLRSAASRQRLAANLHHDLGFLFGLQGKAAEAREHFAVEAAICKDLGLEWQLAAQALDSGASELFMGDPVAAEAVLRQGQTVMTRMGQHTVLSTLLTVLAQTVLEQGRLDEAEQLARLARETGSSDDLGTVIQALGVRARVRATKGDTTSANALLREALRLADGTDMLWLQGRVRMDLAEFRRIVGDPAGAAAAATEALALFNRKGASILARGARAFITAVETARRLT